MLERSTLRTRSDRIPAQRPAAKGALAEVQTGQSAIWPIPIGRATRSRSRISKAARITFITSGYRRWSRCSSQETSVGFCLSVFSVFFNPAAASVVPALVKDEDIVGANSAIWSAAVVSQIALAPLAGALVALAGPGPAFGLNAISFVVSALCLQDYGSRERRMFNASYDPTWGQFAPKTYLGPWKP